MCSSICKCIGCKNFEESPERKTLMHLADAAEVRVQQQTAAKTKLSSQISDLLMRTTPVISSGGGRYGNTSLLQRQEVTGALRRIDEWCWKYSYPLLEDRSKIQNSCAEHPRDPEETLSSFNSCCWMFTVLRLIRGRLFYSPCSEIFRNSYLH